MDLSEAVKVKIIEIIEEREKAWRIKFAGGILWFPKSESRVVNNYLYISKWLAEQEGITNDLHG